MFQLELLPAAHGDAIWIEYGNQEKPHRILIDGGPAATYESALRKRVLLLPPSDRHIDLLVVTHIDADHIDGAIILLREAEQLGLTFGEIWFNGWPQIAKAETEGFQPLQGEFLSALLNFPRYKECWNARTGGLPIQVPDEGELPTWEFPEGARDSARITLLSPGTRQIARLRARWASALRDFSPGDSEEALRRLNAREEYRPPPPLPVFGAPTFGDDRSPANGSSIAFLIEHEGASCLLAGDAHARVLATTLRRLADARAYGHVGALRIDAVKLPHHGSASNISPDLLSTLNSRYWLVSTNGQLYQHPNRTMADLVASQSREVPEFLCNYDCATTRALAAVQWGAQGTVRTSYPGKGAAVGPAGGLLFDLSQFERPSASIVEASDRKR